MKRLLPLCIVIGIIIVLVMSAGNRGVTSPVVSNKVASPGSVGTASQGDLSNKGLTKIEPSFFQSHTSITELNLSNNSISGALPSQIQQLQNLRVLNASHNLMTGVPAEIGQLKNLEILDLSYNRLTGLPNELGNLKNLKILNLAGNAYSVQDLEGIRKGIPQATIITQ